MKKSPNIQITKSDFDKLQKILQEQALYNPASKEALAPLRQELERAEIRESDAIPDDVITLHSKARLIDLDHNEVLEYAIVPPEEADAAEGRISILAPLGTAMLGYRKGDTFEWTVPAGKSRYRVEEILYQPESVRKSA